MELPVERSRIIRGYRVGLPKQLAKLVKIGDGEDESMWVTVRRQRNGHRVLVVTRAEPEIGRTGPRRRDPGSQWSRQTHPERPRHITVGFQLSVPKSLLEDVKLAVGDEVYMSLTRNRTGLRIIPAGDCQFKYHPKAKT